MAYGYRIYTFSVRTATKRDDRDLCDGETPFADTLLALLDGLVDRGVIDGVPDLRKPSEIIDGHGQRGGRRSVMLSAEKVGTGHVRCHLVTGRIGDTDWVLGGGSKEEIRDRASGNELRLDFLLPRAGERGVLVAEARGRTVHVETLLRLLVREGYETQPTPGGDEWLNFRANQVIDVEYLAELMRDAQKVSVEVEQTGTGGTGTAKANRETIHYTGFSQHVATEIAKVAGLWAVGGMAGRGAIDPLLHALGISQRALEKSNMSLSMPVIRLQSSSGERLTVTPGDVQEVFTYPLTDDLRPSDSEWRTAVQRAMDLARREKIPLVVDDR